MHITRPSTRHHAPPGGNTSISFGDSEPPAPSPGYNPRHAGGAKDSISFGDPSSTTPAPSFSKAAASAAAVTAGYFINLILSPLNQLLDVEALTAQVEAISITPTNKHTVCLVVSGVVGVDAIISTTVSALSTKGVKSENIAIVNVTDPTVLPSVVKRVVRENSFRLVLAVAVLTGDSLKHLSESLVTTLVQFSLQTDVAIIPCVINRDSLLEIKALLPSLADTWAASASFFLEPVPFTAAPVPQEPARKVIVDASTTSPQDLLEAFRDTLKVFALLFP